MARIGDVERRLIEWGNWKRSAIQTEWSGEAGCPSTSIGQTDCLVSALPKPLQATVIAFYVVGGSVIANMKKLGCPETTIIRRIGRAHLLIADLLNTTRDRERQEEHLSRITGDATGDPRRV